MNPAALAAAKRRADAAANGASPAIPRQAGPESAARKPSSAIFNNLNQPGLSAADEGNGVTPPDTTGAIGPNFYMEFVNQFVGVFDRNTLARVNSLDLASFVGAPSGLTTTDVQIQWDPQSNRWIYALIGFQTGNNYVLFGWTKTADPTNLPGGWCRYGVGTGSSLNDYPKLGHDANFITIGSNVYSDTLPTYPFVTANMWAIPKPLAGDTTCSSPVSAWYFADATHLLHNADGSLAFTPVPANTADGSSTGYIVGATPVYQQTGLLIGVVTSSFVIGLTTLYLHRVIGIGSPSLPAPQATLMATIIKGLLSQNLPWGLVLVGVFITVTLELCGIHSLSFAVGSYLPIATTAPIFAGGLVRAYVEKKTGRAEESEVSAGTLFSSGLIAGGSLAGILYAVLFGSKIIQEADADVQGLVPFIHEGTMGMIAGGLLFLALALVLGRAAQKKIM